MTFSNSSSHTPDKTLALPPHSRAMWMAGAMYALEMSICAALLWTGYAWYGEVDARWAVVSAIVVLQPGLRHSFAASVFRVAANLIGAATGLAAASLLGHQSPYVILAMLLVVLCCLSLRLEQSLRSACVSVLIVMTTGEGRVVATAIQRATAVAIGATLAISVQLLVEYLRRAWRGAAPAVELAAAASSKAEE